MEKEFVTYSIAKALKDLGYNKPCFGYFIDGEFEYFYNTPTKNRINNPNPISSGKLGCTAPLWQQAVDWIRTEYKINVEANYLPNIQKYRCLFKPMNIIPKDYKSIKEFNKAVAKYYGVTNYDEPYGAWKEGVEEAIEIIKKSKQNV